MDSTTVVVVGAGVAGLACARELQGRGLAVTVLEARERLGGRIRTLRLPATFPLELGAQVVHGSRAVTWDVVRGAGLDTDRQPQLGFRVAVGGRRYDTAEATAAGIVLPWRVEAALVRARLSDVSARDAVLALGLSPESTTAALAWLSQRWAADPAELSAAGMARQHFAGEGEFVVRDGYDRVAEALASGLDVHFAATVAGIRWEAGGAELDVAGRALACRALVMTAPPQVAVGLDWRPALSSARIEAASALAHGDAITVAGRAVTAAPATEWVLDAAGAGGFWRAVGGSPLIVGWLKGSAAAAARELAADGTRTRRLVGRALPWAEDTQVTDVAFADWGADTLSLGAYPFPRVGAEQASGRWAAGLDGTVFFAGDATCGDRLTGRVHGAIESGLRAAGEVIRALRV